MTRVTPQQLAATRGCMLGLMLGDAIGAAGSTVPSAGTLRATSAGQLACFTVEGLVRAHVRGMHKGICHPPGQVWHAYVRWATMQRISGVRRWQETDWPDGWLAQVPALRERRGSAPATVTALQGGEAGTLEKPGGTSIGAHGLTRSLPAGLCTWWVSPGELGASIAALSHSGDAAAAAALGAAMIHLIGSGHTIVGAAMRARSVPHGSWRDTTADLLAPALAAAEAKPRQPSELARLAPDATAQSALLGGVYVAASFAGREQVREALLFAAATGAKHAATVAGALLGAAHGPDALPVDWMSRMELAWVADTLARDLVTQVANSPSGAEYVEATDPHWWERYPGW
ncbi:MULTISPECIES: ADP-ribosylglycohydrolase family protein [unclassified Micromonospora]|uniref:ADP-ribosylglycohydrolase family protein n=1 Tax=unclassified Micromonospora TaxID=2617518 RepID=UPI002FF1EB91